MATQYANGPAPDPFGLYDKTPSLSFKDAPPGTVYTGIVSRLPEEVAQRDMVTREVKFWKDGNPMMAVVLHLDVTMANGAVETRSVWARKPSSMFRAIGEAQRAANTRIQLGGRLSIKFVRTEPSKTPGFNAQKIYEARYEPPDAFASAPHETSSIPTGTPQYARPAQPAQPQPSGRPSAF